MSWIGNWFRGWFGNWFSQTEEPEDSSTGGGGPATYPVYYALPPKPKAGRAVARLQTLVLRQPKASAHGLLKPVEFALEIQKEISITIQSAKVRVGLSVLSLKTPRHAARAAARAKQKTPMKIGISANPARAKGFDEDSEVLVLVAAFD